MSDLLWQVVKRLPTDYTEYGGKVKRWEDVEGYYPDCSGCQRFHRLHNVTESSWDSDWGVCANPDSPRAGLLTWEHQAGVGCFK
jgi:hypothetical protein